MARVWIKNPEQPGVTREVAASALSMLAASGWQQLDDTEIAELAEQRAAATRAREAALTPAPKTPAAPVVAVKRTVAGRRQDASNKESEL